MTTGLRIQAGEIIDDIRSGLTDFELMSKYSMSALDLRNTIQKLLDGDIIQSSEVYHRRVLYDDSLDDESRREIPRHYLALLLPVYEADNPNVKGWLTDITEQGVGVRGIKAVRGEFRAFVIVPERFSRVDQIVFETECRWAEDGNEDVEPTAGFQITGISSHDLVALKEFIRVITIDN